MKSLLLVVALTSAMCSEILADDVILYSSTNEIRGINVDQGTENVLTVTPYTTSTNALAMNPDNGVVYYGSGTEVFIWDIALGSGTAAHSRMNNFATGAVQAQITHLQSGSGSYLNGIYYVSSEEGSNGHAEEIYALTMSADGRTVLSAQALGLLSACDCTFTELGGFGDIAAVQEGGSTVLYAITTTGSDNTKNGRWRFDLGSNTFTHLAATSTSSQLGKSVTNEIFTNIGTGVRTMNKATGAISGTNLMTTAATIFDYSSGFTIDFGDAPDSYGSAMHRMPDQTPATTFLGALPPDNEAGTLNSTAGGANGLGDDQTVTDDEDAVSSLNSLNTGASAYAFAVSCTAGAYVSAWIDFNRNGVFDAGERSNNAPQICTGGTTTLAWTGLSSNVAGASYARIRVADSATEVSSPTGLSNSGEVEDHSLSIVSAGSGSQVPEIRIGKVASVADTNVTMTLRALNSGNTSLSNISLTDNLDDAFGAGNFTIVQAPQIINSPAGFTVNGSYSGSAPQTDLLGSGGVLAPGEEVRVRMTVHIDSLPGGVTNADFTNQAFGSGISPASGFTEDLSAPSLDLTTDTDQPTPISIRSELQVSGRVFIDASLDSATSHDGQIQTNEVGVSDRLVSALVTGNGQLVDTALTDGNGDWVLQLDGAFAGVPLTIEVQAATAQPFVSEAAAYSVGSVSDGQVQITPVAGMATTGVNVGVVSRPTLQLDQVQTTQPNSSVQHIHRYLASSPGQLALTLSAQTSPTLATWPMSLLRDQNCNDVIDATDVGVGASFAVSKDELVCLIVSVFVPADQALGATHTASLSATLTLADAAGTGHSVQFVDQNTDRITVVSARDGRLLLRKSVRNVTLSGTAMTSNTGLPGHVLEYTIEYLNQGAGPISQLVINDSAPAYTQVQGASVTCGSTPVSLSCTPAVSSADVRWDFVGSLPAGADGNVSYRVTID